MTSPESDGAGGGEQFAGFEGDAGCGEFGFDGRTGEAHGEHGLALAVAANGTSRVEAVEVDPALDHPGGVRVLPEPASAALSSKW